MQKETRIAWEGYLSRQAEINGNLPLSHMNSHFTIAPSVAQTLENKTQESSEFLQKINVTPVPEQEGDKLGLGVSGPVASTSTSTTTRRQPRSVHTLDNNKFRCEQTNFDTFISYSQLDMWARFKDFQQRISNAIVQRRALDRIMIGFNGTQRVETSDLAANPLLQDVNIGWLQQYRTNAAARVMSGVTLTSRDQDNKVIASGTYGNLDALAADAVSSLLDEWYKSDPNLVVICGRNLVNTRNHPILNSLSQTNPNSEAMAGQLLVARKEIGAMPTFIAPFFPDGSMFITAFKNLSIYTQDGKQRRMLKDEPEYNRVATYESANDGYVVEDYGLGCLIEGITFAQAAG